jgi:hypothetical protein
MPMASSKRTWVVLGLVALGGVAAWRALDSGEDAAGDRVENQLWISALPKDDREMIDHLVLVDHEDGRFGVRGRSSAWRHDVEILKWGREKDVLLLFFPQTRSKAKWTVRQWSCAGEAPKPFELCLEIKGDGARKLFYSREEWEIDPGEAAASLAEIARDTPELEGTLDPTSVSVSEDD